MFIEAPTTNGKTSSSESDPVAQSVSTLVELLRWRAMDRPERLAYTFLSDGDAEEDHLTYAELDRKARSIATVLQSIASPGDRALLLYPSGLDYITAFFGCLYAGVVAVPAYPPRPSRRERSMGRIEAIVADCRPVAALCATQVFAAAEKHLAQTPDLQNLKWQTTDDVSDTLASGWQEAAVTSRTLAFLQYTSGSTAAPKGVMVSHGNLLHNQAMIKRSFQQTEKSVVVGWLPLYHDMGLIGNVLQPLYLGARCILMSPTSFLTQPFRWLQAISRYRATTSGGPNFAYELCVRKISDQQRASIDLSCWTTAFNGAEPIKPETLDRFAERFASRGFRRETLSPCYGLAEATLIVSGGIRQDEPDVLAFDAARLEENKVVEVPTGAENARSLVNCGRGLLDQTVTIVNPETLIRCDDDVVGEIWVSGPSIAQGYWNRPDDTASTFEAFQADTSEGPFLRTGDLGFLTEGRLFVTGRLKDLIVIRGRNLYPQDIELTVERSNPSLRAGCVAAFSIEISGEEQLVVLQELEYREKPDISRVIEDIRQAVSEEHEALPQAIVLIAPGTIPKTSSGKIRRHACRESYLAGNLVVMGKWSMSPSSEPSDSSPVSLNDVEWIRGWLTALLAAKVGLTPRDIDASQAITRYGIDSLVAIDLVHKLETDLGVSLPAAALFEGTSIAELAELVSKLASEPSRLDPVVSGLDSNAAQFGLSRGQQALYFLHNLAPNSSSCNISVLARVHGDLNPERLRLSFQSLIDRHPSLRVNFISTADGPVQTIREGQEVHFRDVDAARWTEGELRARIDKEAGHEFNLEEDNLLRTSLYRQSNELLLLLVVHHIVVDFWSLSLLLEELGTHYLAGSSLELPARGTQFSHYVEWQESMLAGPAGDRLFEYWTNRLSGELPMLELPTDRVRQPIQTYKSNSKSFCFSRGVTDELHRLSRERGVTLSTLLMAVFQVLLHRYTGQDDILVGALTSGRTRSRFADVVGYFVNPVVVRGDFSAQETFGSFLTQITTSFLEASRHQDYPFPLLVENLRPERDGARPPLVQSMFSFQNAHLPGQEALTRIAVNEGGARVGIGRVELEFLTLDQRATQYELTLRMAATGDGVAGSLDYNSDLFDESTITRLLGHFKTLTSQCLSNPDCQISDLPMLPDAERDQLLVQWNDTRTEYSSTECVHSLIENRAALMPDAVALMFEEEQLTYRELNIRANKVAHRLRRLGIGPDRPVGICLARSAELVVGMLGILKAGGAYVPLDPWLPRDRLSLMIEDSGASVIVTQQGLPEKLPTEAAQLLYIDTELDEAGSESDLNPSSAAFAENLAYVIYTSGSTGKPKGVMVNHRNVVNFFVAMDRELGPEPGLWLAVTSISFDISLLELLWTLSRGFVVLIQAQQDLPQNRAALPNAGQITECGIGEGEDYSILAQIERHGVTHLQCTPSMARLLACGPRAFSAFGKLQKLLLGGEALPLELARDLGKAVVKGKIHNMYGPTETTVWSTTGLVQSPVERISIGRPIVNTETYVLNEQLEPAPVNVAGGLYIGGDGVTRGYVNAPSLTAERFLPDPFASTAGSRLYASGDVSRYWSDGKLEILARADQQVKLRGYRIELGEVETAIERHPLVRQAVVLVQDDPNGEKRLIAYVVNEPGSSVNAKQIGEFLREQVPEYMIPSALMTLEAMPLTHNGKIHRKALPALSIKIEARGTYEPPRDPLEEVLTEMLCELLGYERVGIHDNFFEIGGHSILAGRFVSRLRETFQIEVPLRAFFQTPTVAGLAQAMVAGCEQGIKIMRIAELFIGVANYSDHEVETLLDSTAR